MNTNLRSVMKTLFLAFTTLLFTQFNALACTKKLVMGTNETNWAPYLIKQDGQFLGIEVDVVNSTFYGSTYCVEWVYFPSLSRVQEELKNGRVDITFAASFTEQRAQYAYFSLPYREEIMLLYKHKDAPDVTTLPAIFNKSHTTAVNRGSFFGDEFEQLRQPFFKQVILTAQAKNRFGMLDKKRVDYVIEDSVVAAHFAKKYNSIMKVNSIAPIHINNVHFMLSKKSLLPADVTAINQLIYKNKEAIKLIYQNN